MSLNRTIIAGRLTKNLELRRTQSGTAVTSFTLAVDGDFKDKQTGEKPVYWVDCVAWSHTAEFMSKYLFEKGRIVVVDGKIQTRNWNDKDGNKRKSVEIVADNVYFGDSKPSGDTGSASQSYTPPGEDFEEFEDDGQEVPF